MDNLRTLRKEHQLSLKQLGEIIGVAESTMSLYETKKREPDQQTLKNIAKYFNVTTDYLLGLSENPAPPESDGIELSEIEFALYAELKEFDDDKKAQVVEYVRFIKQQKQGK